MSKKRVLVTGSSRGIGRAIALRLATDGWDVAVHFNEKAQAAEEVIQLLGERASGVYEANLGDIKQAKKLVSRVLKDGPLHAVVNNAGVYVTMDFAGCADAAFDAAFSRCMTVNFEAPAWIVREASQHFIKNGGGVVINVASRVGHRGEPGAAFYSASKAALLNLTKALAVEHAKHNVRHFAIAPGWVNTAMARDGMGDKEQEILASIPIGRMASPEDCAAAVSFLVKDETAYMSGNVIDINGASYLR
ncbi:MAG: SDR family NAD(P)-dependent oxidoreductase [Fimbriimonadaceae bacterium]